MGVFFEFGNPLAVVRFVVFPQCRHCMYRRLQYQPYTILQLDSFMSCDAWHRDECLFSLFALTLSVLIIGISRVVHTSHVIQVPARSA
eukprot:6460352-Amphidinium_carterae.1